MVGSTKAYRLSWSRGTKSSLDISFLAFWAMFEELLKVPISAYLETAFKAAAPSTTG